MRLTKNQHQAIKQSFLESFGDGEIYLFGSRVDDTKRGGDIDLYIIPQQELSVATLFEQKIDFLGRLQERIGEQKIDVLLSKDKSRPIEKEALSTGEAL